ncbi:hypothetical protein QFZ28_005681 [Neobacillus niacini]|nr:hypothetical protein [Neobacillus niacini]
MNLARSIKTGYQQVLIKNDCHVDRCLLVICVYRRSW